MPGVRVMAVALLLALPADQSSWPPPGPLLARLLSVPASAATRTETVVSRFAPPRTPVAGTLGADDDVHDLAAVLDELGVDEAAFVDDVLRFHGGPLIRYRALATGVTARAAGPSIVIAFAMRDEAEAAEQLPRLDALLRTGESTAARRPWSDLLTIERLETRGRIVVAVLGTRIEHLWLTLEREPDTLLQWTD